MKDKPIVSVIVPAYNAATTIAGTLETVLAQTLHQFEIIVIDDGSTDDTRNHVNAIADSRISLYSFDNSGPAFSRNRGIRLAQGNLIAFLDADDHWAASKLMDQCAYLHNCPEVAVVYGWADYVDIQYGFLANDSRPTYSGVVYDELLRQNFIISGSNIMVRREALFAAGLFNETLPAVEDWELNTRLAANNEFGNLPHVVVKYRQSPGSLSQNIDVMEPAFIAAVELVFNGAPQEFQHLRKTCSASYWAYLSVRCLQSKAGAAHVYRGLKLLLRALKTDKKQTARILGQTISRYVRRSNASTHID